MALLTIRLYGDPILRRKAAPVAPIDEQMRTLAGDMIETMVDAPGVGLAAPQIGRSIRLLVADASYYDGGDGPRALFNPEIIDSWGEWIYDEGCLSVPGVNAEIVRPEGIVVRFQDLSGADREEEFHLLWARVLQHEIDHLNGKLFVDYLSPMRRALVLRKLRELAKESRTRLTL